MKAVCWFGTHDVRVENVPEPKILNPKDAIVRITSTAICGSDLHLYDGYIPSMEKGDILGHEFMGEIVEVGKEVKTLKTGDRVVVPFTISCGNCFFCKKQLWSLCDNSNPNAWMAETMYGFSGAGLYGYSHMLGGYAGGQAEYARIPFADHGPIKVPEDLPDDKVLFLTDIFPTGYMAADNCGIEPGDVVAVWGCGPVGQFAIRSAYMLGAERVIAIDRVPERLRLAIQACRKGGTVSVPGVYGGFIDKMPFGAAFAKGLTFKMGQTHVQRYLQPLLERIQQGDIDPSFLITHRLGIDEAPQAYKTFKDKADGCIKVVLKP